jgi:hypothetical protein
METAANAGSARAVDVPPNHKASHKLQPAAHAPQRSGGPAPKRKRVQPEDDE